MLCASPSLVFLFSFSPIFLAVNALQLIPSPSAYFVMFLLLEMGWGVLRSQMYTHLFARCVCLLSPSYMQYWFSFDGNTGQLFILFVFCFFKNEPSPKHFPPLLLTCSCQTLYQLFILLSVNSMGILQDGHFKGAVCYCFCKPSSWTHYPLPTTGVPSSLVTFLISLSFFP